MNLSRVTPNYSIRCFRSISTSATKYVTDAGTGKKRTPWDKRFAVNAKDIGPTKEGGSKKMLEVLPERLVAPTSIMDKHSKRLIPVKEMVPEFVVPDLTDFELKPYVTYTAKEIKQNKLTPKEIFNSVYARDIEEKFKAGEIKVIDGQVYLEDGTVLDLESGKSVMDSIQELNSHLGVQKLCRTEGQGNVLADVCCYYSWRYPCGRCDLQSLPPPLKLNKKRLPSLITLKMCVEKW